MSPERAALAILWAALSVYAGAVRSVEHTGRHARICPARGLPHVVTREYVLCLGSAGCGYMEDLTAAVLFWEQLPEPGAVELRRVSVFFAEEPELPETLELATIDGECVAAAERGDEGEFSLLCAFYRLARAYCSLLEPFLALSQGWGGPPAHQHLLDLFGALCVGVPLVAVADTLRDIAETA